MKIAHLIPAPEAVGGVQSYVRRLARAQQLAGHEVSVTTRDGLGGPAPGIDLLHAHDLYPVAGDSKVPVVRHLHGHWPYCPSGSRFLGRWNVACGRAYSFVGCAWGHVVDHCGSVRPAGIVANFRRTGSERRMLRSVRSIAVSEFVLSQMLRSGYDPGGVDVLHLPAPEAEDSPPAPPPADRPARFLFIGRLVPQKGCSWLLEAAARGGTDLRIDVAGDGPERPRLERMCRRLRISDRVRFLGWLDEAAVADALRGARGVVFPSLWPEPAGLVTLESAAAARPAIVSRVGGIPEYAERCGHAILIDPGDVDGMAAAMCRLAADAAAARQAGETGWRNARDRCSMQAHLRSLDAVYARAIDDHPRAQ